MKKFTKNLIALGLIGAMSVTAFAACSNPQVKAAGKDKTEATATSIEGKENDKSESTTESKETEMKDDVLLGGWAASEDMKITDDLKKIFDKAMEGLDGVDYEPLAYLSSQVVAGRNHCFLCKATVVSPEAVPYYALVYIYERFDGTCEVININKVLMDYSRDLETDKALPGGWTSAEDPAITADVEKVMKKATEAMTGAVLEPVAYIGSQVVAGTNHAIFCRQTPSIPSSQVNYVIVYIYEDLEGNCEITDFQDITISADN